MDLPLLASLQGMVADTVVTLEARDRIALAADLAVLVAAAAMAVLALALVRALAAWNRTITDVREMVRQNLGPVSDRARTISDNVEFITHALRADVERLNASVQSLTARLHQASAHMEDRIEEFNALMEVVQGEAEDLFLDTAATVRGVRESARAMGRRREREGTGPTTGEAAAPDDFDEPPPLPPRERAAEPVLPAGEG